MVTTLFQQCIKIKIKIQVVHYVLCIFTLQGNAFSVKMIPAMLTMKIMATLFWIVDMAFVQVSHYHPPSHITPHTPQTTTYRMEKWVLLDDSADLARKYLRTWFVADLLATLPIDLVVFALVSEKWGIMMCVLRTIRLARIPSLFNTLTPNTSLPWRIECLLFLFWVGIFVHTATCIWLACASDEELSIEVPISEDVTTAYFSAFYFTVSVLTNVGFGDMSPSQIGTKYYVMFLEIAGSVLLVALGGRAGAYFITIDPFELLVLERRRRLESLMQRNNIPWAIQRLAFSVYPVILDASVRDYKHILDQLPQLMQIKLGFHIKRRMLRKVPLFVALPLDVIGQLAWRLVDEYADPKEYIIHAGDPGEEMYFVANGVVEVLAGMSGLELKATLSDGTWFGEIALLLPQSTRVASVRTVTSCCLYVLKKPDFERVIAQNKELKQMIHDHAMVRLEELNRIHSVTDHASSREEVSEDCIRGASFGCGSDIPIIEEEAPSDSTTMSMDTVLPMRSLTSTVS